MRYKVIAFLLLILTAVDLAEAQQAKVSRIGYLGATTPGSAPAEAFRQGLRDLGYVEGKNIIIEYRYAEGVNERFANLAAELVSLKVDVILTGGTPATQAAKNATQTVLMKYCRPCRNGVGRELSSAWREYNGANKR